MCYLMGLSYADPGRDPFLQCALQLYVFNRFLSYPCSISESAIADWQFYDSHFGRSMARSFEVNVSTKLHPTWWNTLVTVSLTSDASEEDHQSKIRWFTRSSRSFTSALTGKSSLLPHNLCPRGWTINSLLTVTPTLTSTLLFPLKLSTNILSWRFYLVNIVSNCDWCCEFNKWASPTFILFIYMFHTKVTVSYGGSWKLYISARMSHTILS